MHFNDHVILDQINTWPQVLVEYLDLVANDLAQYESEERRIDNAAIENLEYRFRRPSNPFVEVWENAACKLRHHLSESPIIGFHATRLMGYEIAAILGDGLRPLDPTFNRERIERLYEDKQITREIAEKLHSQNAASHSNRRGLVWFFHCLASLKDESGLKRLFRSWGGEANYWALELDPAVGSRLRTLGTPSIVIGRLALQHCVDCWIKCESQLLKLWLHQHKGLHERDMPRLSDTRVGQAIPVLRVITQDDPEFEALTDYSTWNLE